MTKFYSYFLFRLPIIKAVTKSRSGFSQSRLTQPYRPSALDQIVSRHPFPVKDFIKEDDFEEDYFEEDDFNEDDFEKDDFEKDHFKQNFLGKSFDILASNKSAESGFDFQNE